MKIFYGGIEQRWLLIESTERKKADLKKLTMMMLMALCLLVYNLGQRQLRIALKTQKATVKNQLNKPTESPTLRWIFQCFQGIHILITQGVYRILNLTNEHCRILQFLPNSCQKYYLLC